MKRIIFHVDVNSAFLSWEACYRIHHLGGKQDLRKLVSAVGGDREKRHGIILAKSIPAKKYHIQTGETVVSAKEKCPGLIFEYYGPFCSSKPELEQHHSGQDDSTIPGV